ncbi:MAG: DUF1805 domain-containing protein [Emergencia sp.]|nr:DUF1805 domain-containing protein [Emergencia sp.]
MIQIENIKLGDRIVQGVSLSAPGGEGHPNMLVLQCDKGYIMCGYLNLDTANAVEDAAAVVSGSCFDDILANPVKAVSTKAQELGVTVGMTGRQAAEALSR